MLRQTDAAVVLELRKHGRRLGVRGSDLQRVRLQDIGGVFYFADVVFHLLEHLGDFACVVGEDVEGLGVEDGDCAEGGLVVFERRGGLVVVLRQGGQEEG